jgi:site-specific DNA recombinase
MHSGSGTALLMGRKSTDLAQGVENQIEECREVADEWGLEVVAEIRENDVSGFKRVRRPDFRAAIEWVGSGKVTHVVMYREDRLTRHLPDLREFATVCQRNHVKVLTAQGAPEYDFRRPRAFTSFQTAGLDAEKFSWDLSVATRMKLAKSAKAGNRHGGMTPFGYRDAPVLDEHGVPILGKNSRVLRKREIVPEEAALIRSAADDILTGRSLRSIANEWNELGFVGHGGARFRASSIRVLFKNPALMGVRRHIRTELDFETREASPTGVDLHEGSWEPILDEDTFKAIERLLTGRSTPRHSTKVLIPSTVLRCSRDGCGMSRTPRQVGKPQYRCSGYTPADQPKGCASNAIGAEALEEWIVGTISSILDPENPEISEDGTELSDLIGRRERIIAERDRDLDDMEAGKLDRDEYQHLKVRRDERLRQIDTQIKGLDSERDRESRLAAWRLSSDEFRLRWEAATIDERRFLIEQLFERIEILPGQRTGPRGVDLSRIVPTFRG